MVRLFALLLLMCLCVFGIARGGFATNVMTIDLASDHVDITTGFTGASLVLYGVHRGDGDVGVTIQGPEKTMIVRKKSNILGAWINRQYMTFRNVPIYYDFALSEDLAEQEEGAGVSSLGLGLDRLKFLPDEKDEPDVVQQSFREALFRNKQSEGLFPLEPKTVQLIENGLFKAEFQLPSNVPIGQYVVEALFFEDGVLIERDQTMLNVSQVGTSANIYHFAQGKGFLYGLFCVGFAISVGWLVTILKRG